MTKKSKIVLVLIILAIVGFIVYYSRTKSYLLCFPNCPGRTDEDRAKLKEDMRIASCPDEKIVDKMPSVIDDTGVIPPPKAYYIKDGKRVEISEYDSVWVSANCEVPVVEVQ